MVAEEERSSRFLLLGRLHHVYYRVLNLLQFLHLCLLVANLVLKVFNQILARLVLLRKTKGKG